MNKVIQMGRLTKDPEVRYSQSATPTAIARLTIAVDRRFKRDNEPAADFFNCTAFGKTAEFVEKYMTKGTKVLISGRLQNNNYTNRAGEKVYSTEIMIEEIEFAESKASQNKGQSRPQYDMHGKQVPDQQEEQEEFMNIPDDVSDEELPFN